MVTSTPKTAKRKSCTVEYTREAPSETGGLIEHLSAIPDETGLVLTSSRRGSDLEFMRRSNMSDRGITLAQLAIEDGREVIFLAERERRNYPEPELVAMLRYCGGYALCPTLITPLPGFDGIHLMSYALSGLSTDNAAALLAALPWPCNSDLRRALRVWLLQLQYKVPATRPDFHAQFEARP